MELVPVVAVRCLVAGEVVDEEAVVDGDAAKVAELAERHGELCRAALEAGKVFRVEFDWGGGDIDRFGTDPSGMPEDAELVPLEDLPEAMARRYGYCASRRMDYVCQRGAGHFPANQHSQLVRRYPDGKIRVATWTDEVARVRLGVMDPEDARREMAKRERWEAERTSRGAD